MIVHDTGRDSRAGAFFQDCPIINHVKERSMDIGQPLFSLLIRTSEDLEMASYEKTA